jgi:hypothetical protein
MDNSSKVVIIDRVQTRRDSMSKLFNGLADTIVAYKSPLNGILQIETGSGKSLEIIETEAGTPLKQIGVVLLSLCHISDKNLVQDVNANLIVYYGGNGGEDSECPINAERIWRSVTEISGIPSLEETRKLLEYARDPREINKPDLLVNPKILQIMPALSILCQGYLAVHVNHAEYASFLSGDLVGKQQKVSKASWWLQGLDVLDSTNNINQQKCSSLREKIENEWKRTSQNDLPPELDKFLGAIRLTKTVESMIEPQIITTDVITAAYSAIANKLDEEYSN